MLKKFALSTLILLVSSPDLTAQPVGTLDLATVGPAEGVYRRLLGSEGVGVSGIPVSGGHDVDGDGHVDFAMAAMRAGIGFGRNEAGKIFLVFGDSQISGTIDTLDVPGSVPDILPIIGDQIKENAGSEIWMGDVTGDGIGDLIICRQNYSPGGTRIGAGALTLLPGGQALRDLADGDITLDLRSPPVDLPIVNFYGKEAPSRLCMWARVGDVTGDGIQDIVVGADREDSNGNDDAGAVYVIRGGAHLASTQTIDLLNFGTVLPGNIARMRPPIGSQDNWHLGATVQVADLDNNGKAEVLAAAALNRSGGSLPPNGGTGEGSGGTTDGTLYIAWDDNFGGDWIPAPDFRIGQGPGSVTTIDGGNRNSTFGEEILGGLDYNGDNKTDLFVGDLTANGWGPVASRTNAGTAHVIYDIASLKGLSFDLDSPPIGFNMAVFVGPVIGAIAGDTAMHGDFNGDGIDDLAFSSPKDNPLGRNGAGTLHIVLGQNSHWPAVSDLRPENFPSSGVDIFEIYGAEGSGSGFAGDVLCYSGADGDVNNDGITDLIINEMQGDGSVTNDVGNLLVFDSATLFGIGFIFRDGFEGPD